MTTLFNDHQRLALSSCAFDAIIFDFDGVLIESEYAGNESLARLLTALGYPITVEQSLTQFVGLGGRDFHDAVERWTGAPLTDEFHRRRRADDVSQIKQGVGAVAGAVDFVRNLPPGLPRAIASSSTSEWIRAHLAHIDLADAFDPHIYSGREHVQRGKPAPDIYLYAAARLGIDIARVAIIEDSPVGVTGAVASGAYVIGLAAGRHCFDGHDALLKSKGAPVVAHDFGEVVQLLR
jgi:beta-phosphoglucomutase-like phosphatase (HAD superfamily)